MSSRAARATDSPLVSNAPATEAKDTLSCTHCGLPVPEALQDPEAPEQFCCAGCRTVYAVIHGEGLDRFYDLRERQGAAPALISANPGEREFGEFDDAEFHRLYCRPRPGGLFRTTFYVDAIHCAACVWLLERLAARIDGVVEIRVDLGRSRVQIDWDPTQTELSEIARRLDSFGYPPEPPRADREEEQVRREDRALLVKIAVTGAIAGNVMLIAFALYGGAFHGMEERFAALFRWASLLLTAPAVLFGGGVFFRGAISALKARVLHMDLPISIGILAGFVGGAVSTVRGVGEIYFDSVTTLIFLLLVGRYLQRRQQRRAVESSQLLYSLAPRRARRVQDGEVREVPVSALTAGDEVDVLAGEVVPADGVVLSGRSTLDMALMTGESRPVDIASGDEVLAGTVNLSASLRVRVEKSGEETRVGQLLQLVAEYGARRPRIVRLADRLSGYFVTIVLSLAALTAGLWAWIEPASALDHTIALLVVTCPCALGLATPLAVAAAIGQAARAGLLVKGGDVFERLRGVGHLWLDKTGTLTEGRVTVRDWTGDDEAKAVVVAIERQSSHPLAVALVRDLEPISDVEVTDVEQILGAGVRARFGGAPVVIGSPRFVAAEVNETPDQLEQATRAALDTGQTPVVVAVAGAVRGVAALGDPIRAGARSMIEQLQSDGWQVGILSGDHEAVVQHVGRELGLAPELCRGSRTPEEKLAVVEESHKVGATTVMVGDGVNDSAALAAASVGIAVGGGAEAALTAADVYLADGNVSAVADLLRGSGRTFLVIRRNLVFSLCYNFVGATLALLGLVHPLVAAVLMPASSLTVIVSSYRARLFESHGRSLQQTLGAKLGDGARERDGGTPERASPTAAPSVATSAIQKGVA